MTFYDRRTLILPTYEKKWTVLARHAFRSRSSFIWAIHAMKHLSVCWNPATREWYCTRCGRTSDHTSVQEAHVELDQYDCQLTSVDVPSAPPGTATMTDKETLQNETENRTERQPVRCDQHR